MTSDFTRLIEHLAALDIDHVSGPYYSVPDKVTYAAYQSLSEMLSRTTPKEPEVYAEIRSKLAHCRFDLESDHLTVKFPLHLHEVSITWLNGFFNNVEYDGSVLQQMGSCDVSMTNGVKQPDLSVAERLPDEKKANVLDPVLLTLATLSFEMVSTQTTEFGRKQAARTITLSCNEVRAVAMFDFHYRTPTDSLSGLVRLVVEIWVLDFWDEFLTAAQTAAVAKKGFKFNTVYRVGETSLEFDSDRVQEPAERYGAYVRTTKDNVSKCSLVIAHIRQSCVIVGEGAEDGDIELLTRDLFRNPIPGQEDEVKVRIPIPEYREKLQGFLAYAPSLSRKDRDLSSKVELHEASQQEWKEQQAAKKRKVSSSGDKLGVKRAKA